MGGGGISLNGLVVQRVVVGDWRGGGGVKVMGGGGDLP